MGKFVIKRTNDNRYMFNLFADNHKIICTSQTYSSLQSCKIGIESVRKNHSCKTEDQTLKKYEELKNPKFEIYFDNAGEYRFRLKASNGEIIAASQGYSSKVACKNGIESIWCHAPRAEIVIEEKEEKENKEEKKEDKKE